MYMLLLSIHAVVRWLVLASLLYALISSIQGIFSNRVYARSDALIRTLSTTLTHIQLLIGFVLYFVLSPLTSQFMKAGPQGNNQIWFFGVYHITVMFIAVGVMTTGGSKAKRAAIDRNKFRITAIYFGISLLMIVLAIPWFRPLLRSV